MLIEAQQKQHCTLVELVCNFSWMRGATNICSPRVRLLRELMCVSSTSASTLFDCAGESLGTSDIGFSLLAFLWTSISHKACWLSFKSPSLISGVGSVSDVSVMLLLRTTLPSSRLHYLPLWGGSPSPESKFKNLALALRRLPGDMQRAFFLS